MKKNRIKIPNQFELFGQTIKIEWTDDLVDKNDAYGEARYRENVIRLQRTNGGVRIPPEKMEAIYIHEVIHWIMDKIGEDDFNKDESRVDRLACALHQVLVTSIYGSKKTNVKTIKSKGKQNQQNHG